MVMLFNRHTHIGHDGQHFGTDVLAAINWRDREVAALDAGTVAEVALFIVAGAVIGAFG